MNISSPGIARNNRTAPRRERHDALLQSEERAGSAARFPAGYRAQMAFLLADWAGNASVAAVLLGIRACTVRRHCRGWPPPPGPRLRRALRRRVVDLGCPRCLSDRAVEEARQGYGKPGARPDGFRGIRAARIAGTHVPENLQFLCDDESFPAS